MIIRAIISVCSNFFVYFTKKNIFLILFYTSSFTKHRYQFIYSTHLFNKIFILLQFFIIPSLTAPLSHKPTIHHYQRSLHTRPPSSPSSHYHHHPTSIIKENQSTQSQTHSIPNPFITHPTQNPIKPNHHPPNQRQDHQNPPIN